MIPQDLDMVMQIEEASFSKPWSRNMFVGEINKNKYAYYITAKDSWGYLMGYAGVWIVLDEAHITTIAVQPLFRKNGIGNLLLEHLLQKASRDDVQKVFLEVRDSNIQARSIYERLGFTVISKRKKYYHDEDALVMMLALGKIKE
jgi:ribosomal-protein-alanine N-acetyltransferase